MKSWRKNSVIAMEKANKVKDNVHHEVKFSLRIIGINDQTVRAIQNACVGYDIRLKKWPDERANVLLIKLVAGGDFAALIDVSKSLATQNIQCGLWVSLVTDLETSGVHVPADIFNLLVAVGASLDFSFTVIPPNEDSEYECA